MTEEELRKRATKLLTQAREFMLAMHPSAPFPHALMACAVDGKHRRMLAENLAEFRYEDAPLIVRTWEARYTLEWVAHVSDAWVKHHTKEDGPVALPLRRAGAYPDRKEALLVEMKSGPLFVCITQIYTRHDSGRPIFDEAHFADTDGRSFSRILGVGEPFDYNKDPFEQ